MKRKYIYPLLIIIVTVGFYYLEGNIENSKTGDSDGVKDSAELSFFYLPTSTTGAIVTHNFYSLSYSEKHEQAEWVAYELKKEHLSKNEIKRPYFEEDRKVRTSSADWRNYKKSGYDRGHLCPAGDRRFSHEAFEETFLTSNISPQDHEFNSGIWNKLEQKVRYWANKYNGVYVVTGGVLTDNLETIGYEHVSVPKYFYKIVLDKDGDDAKMIAFLFPHRESDEPLNRFVVAVDKIEELTGIDFFTSLDDPLENKLERSTDTKNWKF
ncbi:DNA/RNA non-specific endonuclease [Aquimarina sp. MMG016]|uniref:DNA/RNA non-specific endonuclease n=1 Tax=Aquimarina sp. MMG016 TaxID=2822690 RepID=UPI001B3A4720|nr:DNA/RNA non-specific endonuclease [Aquimarina sp. MMG016]MBQ4818787.1 DNA/RNA non-specific endonuclease [Aquimarina sp. MMG016]